MIRLRIKIKNDDRTSTKTDYLEDSFAICKTNPKLVDIVEKACHESNIDDIQDVKVTAYFDW